MDTSFTWPGLEPKNIDSEPGRSTTTLSPQELIHKFHYSDHRVWRVVIQLMILHLYNV